MAQSTNDAYPTALRLSVIFAIQPLARALDDLAFAFKTKSVEFADVLKMGRTQLQDAVPMTVGQEFDAFHVTLKEDVARLSEIGGLFREISLGATAIGTGINADPRYASLAVEELARASRQPLVPAANLIEATSDMGAFVLFSGLLKRIAVKLSKICNDLRLLVERPAHRFRRTPPAPGSGRLLDHAGQGKPGDPRGGEPGRLPRDRSRPDRNNVRRGRPAAVERLRTHHRLLRAELVTHVDSSRSKPCAPAASKVSKSIANVAKAWSEAASAS